MLQSIRDHTQGWIAGIIISILILSFALWGVHSYLGNDASSTVAASVNGVEISKQQVAIAYERMHRQLQMQNNSSYQLPEKAEINLKNRALEALINIQVLKQASLSHNYRISPYQVANFLEAMPEFQVNGRFSQVRFQKLLETTLYNMGDFLELIKTSLLIDQPRLGMIFTSFALPNEITDTIVLLNQERDIAYLMLSFEYIAKQPIQISDEQIKNYYTQHQDEFKTPEQVTIEYVELSLKDLVLGIHPADETLKKFYTENNNSFVNPMEWKLENIVIPLAENATDKEISLVQKKVNEIFQQAKQGKDFSALAKEFKLEKADSKLQGWIMLNKIPTELQKTVLGLTKPGMVAEPVRTANGIFIIKAVEIKEPIVRPYDQVKDKVKEVYIRQQAEEKFADLRDKLSNITYEHPNSLQDVEKSLSLPVRTSEPFTKDKGGKDITANNKVREAAFNNDVLNLGNNSDVVPLSNEDAVVIRIKTHSPATLLALSTVEKQIIDKLKAAEIEAKTAKLANEISQKLKAGARPEQIAQQYNLTWNNIGFIARRAGKINSAILESAFEMPKPININKPTYSTAKMPNGYAVIALKAVKSVNNIDHKQYQVFAEQIQNTQGLMEYELYKQSLMHQAKIETN